MTFLRYNTSGWIRKSGLSMTVEIIESVFTLVKWIQLLLPTNSSAVPGRQGTVNYPYVSTNFSVSYKPHPLVGEAVDQLSVVEILRI
jgi:hypothetical protein